MFSSEAAGKSAPIWGEGPMHDYHVSQERHVLLLCMPTEIFEVITSILFWARLPWRTSGSIKFRVNMSCGVCETEIEKRLIGTQPCPCNPILVPLLRYGYRPRVSECNSAWQKARHRHAQNRRYRAMPFSRTASQALQQLINSGTL